MVPLMYTQGNDTIDQLHSVIVCLEDTRFAKVLSKSPSEGLGYVDLPRRTPYVLSMPSVSNMLGPCHQLNTH